MFLVNLDIIQDEMTVCARHVPPVGLEPTTWYIEDTYSIHCAMGADTEKATYKTSHSGVKSTWLGSRVSLHHYLLIIAQVAHLVHII